MSCCHSCAQTGTSCSTTQTSGLAAEAGDSAAKRIMKELGMFVILTSPAWVLLLALPKPDTR